MELPRIQYVTHPDEQFDDLSWVHRLAENGVKWIQLRLKESDVTGRFPEKHYLAYFHETADKFRVITSALDMILTINDSLEVAQFSMADGLHVGQEDEDPESVNKRLKPDQVLGGTANSFEEILHFNGVPMAYFGVGPYRETTTKEKLKPVLGPEGYSALIRRMKAAGITTPVYAIGGITPSDVAELLEAGVYGIALSGALFHAGHQSEAIQLFTKIIDNYVVRTGR